MCGTAASSAHWGYCKGRQGRAGAGTGFMRSWGVWIDRDIHNYPPKLSIWWHNRTKRCLQWRLSKRGREPAVCWTWRVTIKWTSIRLGWGEALYWIYKFFREMMGRRLFGWKRRMNWVISSNYSGGDSLEYEELGRTSKKKKNIRKGIKSEFGERYQVLRTQRWEVMVSDCERECF